MRRLVILLAGVVAGCGGASLSPVGPAYIRPTVAVMKFDSRASVPTGWNLGEGMKDILVDRLVATGRFHVIERPELELIMKELQFQQTGATRSHNRAKLGRLKNVEYLVKGTITDFGHVSTTGGFAEWADRLDVFGSKHRAVLGMTLYIVEVESGEIICSESLEESVSANDLNMKAAYKDISFGGHVFYRTPLGRATARVMDRAVRRIADDVAVRPWQPKIAQVNARSVIINGGQNRAVRPGDQYEVLALGRPVIDPDTGDVIGHSAGGVLARIHVVEVHPGYAVAEVVQGVAGDLEPGQRCRSAAAILPAHQPPKASEAPVPTALPAVGGDKPTAAPAPFVRRDGISVTIGGDLTVDATASK